MKSDVSFYGKWRVVLWKVTCRFMKSDVSFYEKWRVVLWKVTCRFMESDVSFYGKWRVVLWEMTCRFMKSDVSFCKRYLNIKPIFAGNDKQTARPNKNSHILGKIWEFLNPNRSLDRYSTIRNWKDNFLSSFIFLLASCFSFVLAVARYAFELTVNNLLNNLMKSVQNLTTDWGWTIQQNYCITFCPFWITICPGWGWRTRRPERSKNGALVTGENKVEATPVVCGNTKEIALSVLLAVLSE